MDGNDACVQAANYASFSLAYALELEQRLDARDAAGEVGGQARRGGGGGGDGEGRARRAATRAGRAGWLRALAGRERGAEDVKRAVRSSCPLYAVRQVRRTLNYLVD